MEEILKYIQDYGFMTVFAGAGMFFLIKFALLKYQQMERSMLEQGVADPKKHAFFQKVDYILRYKLPDIKLNYKGTYCAGRTAMFSDMLETKFELWRDMITRVCATDYEHMSNADIRQMFTQETLNLVSQYEAQWQQDGVPKVVVSKFHEWHDNHAEMFLGTVDSITLGACFGSQREIINAILEMNMLMVLLTLLDAEKTLGDLNGEISGLEYKGQKLL
ncbi:hypothetical protein IPJ72_04120 [Candidatus Peregrinibacteria bacterium]|nr:MAG: hypothetical protein IPJ72_04120 [Candidatus Peregrinibacteria bacterium]